MSGPRATEGADVPLVLDVESAAELLGIGRNLMYQLIGSGDVRAIRLGRRIVVSREAIRDLLEKPTGPSDLEAWIQAGRPGPKP